MKFQVGVLINDQVTRGGLRVPASVLMEAEESGRIARRAQGLPAGTPTHIQHDMHRPVGWTYTLGHLIDGSMVRAIGMTEEAETDEEKADLATLSARYWDWILEQGMEAFKKELPEMLKPIPLDGARYEHVEAYAVSKPGLAAALYPELFDEKSTAVDKDGLTDFRALTTRLRQVQPGIFLDPERRLIIFAHRFFRRSLSHKNKLNEYFLQSFERTANQWDGLTARLRLDPDLVGHADTLSSMLELEHWHGPRFSDDVESIPHGSAEHKAANRIRHYEGVDRTHFWWKSPETRKVDGTEVAYRTFEVEELIDNVSAGLPGERFGCRYAHAEFSAATSAITHFDGAIRAYPAEAYLERIERQIDRAGKHSEYTKLFRFDGPLPVEYWKRLVSDYFRGNPLIPEYLGAPPSDFNPPAEATSSSDGAGEPEELSALISLAYDRPTKEFGLDADVVVLPGADPMLSVETGGGAIHTYLCTKGDLENAIVLGPVDGMLNLARMGFGASATFPALMKEIVAGVAQALPQDVQDLGLRKLSVALSWPLGDMIVMLSLRGTPSPMACALDQLFSVIDPTRPPSDWIEPLSEFVKRLAPRSGPVWDLWGVTEGLLTCQRTNDAKRAILIPAKVAEKLMAKGLLSSDGPDIESVELA